MTNIVDVLRNDSIREMLRGPPGLPGKAGKTGAPGLTVSVRAVLLLNFSLFSFFMKPIIRDSNSVHVLFQLRDHAANNKV